MNGTKSVQRAVICFRCGHKYSDHVDEMWRPTRCSHLSSPVVACGCAGFMPKPKGVA